MAATLITLLVVNASDQKKAGKDVPVCYITLPAAFVMFCWDLGSGWLNRKRTQDIAREALARKTAREKRELERGGSSTSILPLNVIDSQNERRVNGTRGTRNEVGELVTTEASQHQHMGSSKENERKGPIFTQILADSLPQDGRRESIIAPLISYVKERHWELRATFPTATTVLSELPYQLLPFAFSMFVLVEGLVSKGWVAVFAYGWDYVC